MADGAHGQNGPSVRECVERKTRPDGGSVIIQHRQTEDETVMAKEFKKHYVTTKNVQVSNCNAMKGKRNCGNHAVRQSQANYCITVKFTRFFKELRHGLSKLKS